MTDEPPRPDPGFRVYVERGPLKADVTFAVIDAYDISVNSMDFGSGFLSTEEVRSLHQLGVAIGAEPFRYCHDICTCGHDSERHALPYHKVRTCREKGCPCTKFEDDPLQWPEGE
jgi:hypothetical protein